MMRGLPGAASLLMMALSLVACQLEEPVTGPPEYVCQRLPARDKDHYRLEELRQFISACQQVMAQPDFDPKFYFYLGRLYYLAVEREEARTLWLMGMEQGDAPSLTALGLLYGVKDDYHGSINAWRQAAEQGDPVAMTELAFIALTGGAGGWDKPERDPDQGFALLDDAVALGYPVASYYRANYQLKRDYIERLNDYRAAAEGGVKKAYERLVGLDEYGVFQNIGGTSEEREWLAWYQSFVPPAEGDWLFPSLDSTRLMIKRPWPADTQ